MWNKYFKKLHQNITTGRGDSHVWRKMIIVREDVQHTIYIWWQNKAEKIPAKQGDFTFF